MYSYTVLSKIRIKIKVKMFRALVSLSVLAVAFCQEFEVLDNLVDFEHGPYQHISLPYPYQDNRDMRVVNIQNTPQDNDIRLDNEYKVFEFPATLKETKDTKKQQDIKTSLSLSSIDMSLKNNVCAVTTKFYGLVKSALTLLVLNIPALILGAVLMVGFCKITSICTKISGIKTLNEAQRELSAFVTPERLDMATELVQEAIRTYRSIQAN